MRFATNTYSEYVIVSAFTLQQWLRERALMLRHTYIVCLMLIKKLSAVYENRRSFAVVTKTFV